MRGNQNVRSLKRETIERVAIFVCTALSAPMTDIALADDGSPGQIASFRIKGFEISERLAREIASVSKPREIPIAEPITVNELVAGECGLVDPAYRFSIAESNPTLVDPTTLDRITLSPGVVFRLPPCIPIAAPRLEARTVQAKDSEWKYWREGGKDFEWGANVDMAAIERIAAQRYDLSDTFAAFNFDDGAVILGNDGPRLGFRELYAAANAHNTGGLDVIVGAQAFVPTAPVRNMSFKVSAFGDVQAAMTMIASNSAVDDAELAEQFTHFTDLLSDCEANQEAVTDADRFVSILVEDVATLSDRGVTISPVDISVIDSGIMAADGSIVNTRSITPATPFGMFGPQKADVDRFTPVSAPNIDKVRDHGTKVASLILGGATGARPAATVGFKLRVNPTVIYQVDHFFPTSGNRSPITDPTTGALIKSAVGRLKTDVVYSAIDDQRASIINLSLGRSNPIPRLVSRLGPNSTTLFVVSAGNYGKNSK